MYAGKLVVIPPHIEFKGCRQVTSQWAQGVQGEQRLPHNICMTS